VLHLPDRQQSVCEQGESKYCSGLFHSSSLHSPLTTDS